MVIIKHRYYKDIPALEVVQQESLDKKAPLIIFVHGFTSAKEHNLHYAFLLAEEGFRVILPDSIYHGERSSDLDANELNYMFWDIVINNIKELTIIKTEIIESGLVDSNKIGVAGTSMGGITTLGALTQYEWIQSGVSLMGSPHYEKFFWGQVQALKETNSTLPITDEQLKAQGELLKQYDLSLQPEKLNGRPLMFWHGERDQVVPFHYTYEFYKQIIPLYTGMEEKLKFISDPALDHKVSREGLLATVAWFKKTLN